MNNLKWFLCLAIIISVFVSSAQEKSLVEIQKEILAFKANFTTHYNDLKTKYISEIESGQKKIDLAKKTKADKIDSLNVQKTKLQSEYDRINNEFEKVKIEFANYDTLSKLTSQLNVILKKRKVLDDIDSYKKYCRENASYRRLTCCYLDEGVLALFVNEPKSLKKLQKLFGDTAQVRILIISRGLETTPLRKEELWYVVNLDTIIPGNFKVSDLRLYDGNFTACRSNDNKLFDFIESYNFENQEIVKLDGVPYLKALQKENLIKLTNSKFAIELKNNKDRVSDQIATVNKMLIETTSSHEKSIFILQKRLSSFDLRELKVRRTTDSLELINLYNYYFVEYPNSEKKYNEELQKAKEKDRLAALNYQKDLAHYDSINTAFQAVELLLAQEYVKKDLNDPYSARFESYKIIPLPKTNAKYPCVHGYILGVNYKNQYGAYQGIKYFQVVFVNGDFFSKAGPSDDYFGSFMMDGFLAMDNWNVPPKCSSLLSPPIKDYNSAELVFKPSLNPLKFKFFN